MPRTAKLKQAFIVVSTGQNLANLPPVLECAEPGDVVVWVESPEARRGAWSEGAKRMLQGHGLANHPNPIEVDDINDPVHVAERLRPAVASLEPSHTLSLVANGGPKLAPIGLLNACRGFPARLLYGQDKPAELWIFDGAMDRSPEKRVYRRHQLDLEDILDERGLRTMRAPQKLWPADAAPEPPRYGADPEYTRQVHGECHRWNRWRETASDARLDETGFRMFHDLLHSNGISRKGYETWLRALAQAFQNGWGQGREPKAKPPTFEDLVSRLEQMPDILDSVYRQTLVFARHAAQLKARFDEGVELSEKDVGKTFERAVASRLFAFLQSRPQWANAVQSAWTGVRVARIDSPHLCQAEWDLVLVLRNAVLLQIECKAAGTAFNAEQKSLDAQLLNLLRAGSQGKMLICGPLYTASAAEPWFAIHQHGLREKAGSNDFLPFTLPGQPETYTVRNERGEDERHCCSSFEAVLERRLNAYIPHSGGV